MEVERSRDVVELCDQGLHILFGSRSYFAAGGGKVMDLIRPFSRLAHTLLFPVAKSCHETLLRFIVPNIDQPS